MSKNDPPPFDLAKLQSRVTAFIKKQRRDEAAFVSGTHGSASGSDKAVASINDADIDRALTASSFSSLRKDMAATSIYGLDEESRCASPTTRSIGTPSGSAASGVLLRSLTPSALVHAAKAAIAGSKRPNATFQMTVTPTPVNDLSSPGNRVSTKRPDAARVKQDTLLVTDGWSEHRSERTLLNHDAASSTDVSTHNLSSAASSHSRLVSRPLQTQSSSTGATRRRRESIDQPPPPPELPPPSPPAAFELLTRQFEEEGGSLEDTALFMRTVRRSRRIDDLKRQQHASQVMFDLDGDHDSVDDGGPPSRAFDALASVASPLASEKALYSHRLNTWREEKASKLQQKRALLLLSHHKQPVDTSGAFIGTHMALPAVNGGDDPDEAATAENAHRSAVDELLQLQEEENEEEADQQQPLAPRAETQGVSATLPMASSIAKTAPTQVAPRDRKGGALASRHIAMKTALWARAEEAAAEAAARRTATSGRGERPGQTFDDDDCPIWSFELRKRPLDQLPSLLRSGPGQTRLGAATSAQSPVPNAVSVSEPSVVSTRRAVDPGLQHYRVSLKRLEAEEAQDAAAIKSGKKIGFGSMRNGIRGRKLGQVGAGPDGDDDARKGDGARGALGAGTTGTGLDTESKWHDVADLPLDRSDVDVVSELDCCMPLQDIHLYQLFCYHHRMIIIIRPVSMSVPNLYAGTFFLDSRYCDALGQPIAQPHLSMEQVMSATRHECRVRGKSINVSLKSSSYPPIDGLIPVNPALGKAYLDAQKREREIEDMILNAKGGVVTISLLKKLKAQRAQAGSLTAAFRRDIETALRESDVKCAALMEQYKADLVLTVDKAAVSRQYIERFNEAQFLGTTVAKWRGFPVYFTEGAAGVAGEVLRDDKDAPVFHIHKGSAFYLYNRQVNDMEKTPTSETANLKPVLVVTHRMFFTSATTQRIEEETDAYLIGPDFDGLTYGYQDPLTDTVERKKKWAETVTRPYLVKSMGLVSDADVEHVKEVRELTEWKQNHGYEMGNTVKSQPITKGTYVVLTPHRVAILNSMTEIIGYCRTAWRHGIPLQLNPNWRVAIDHMHLPRPYGEDIFLPLVDDCGYSALLTRFEEVGTGSPTGGSPTVPEGSDLGKAAGPSSSAQHPETYEHMKHRYVPLSARAAAYRDFVAQGDRRARAAINISDSVDEGDLFDALTLVLDKKALAAAYFDVRRWQLLPRWFRPADQAATPAANAIRAPAAVDAGPPVMNRDFEEGGLGTRVLSTMEVDPDFEAFRKAKEDEMRVVFNDIAENFAIFHPRSHLLTTLKEYLNPNLTDLTGEVPTSPVNA